MSKTKNVSAKSFSSDSIPREDFIPEAGADFVITPYIEDLTNRALAYLRVGYAVHLSGPAGTGKSTLAMHIASQLGQPCTLLHGDDEFKASDLLGRDTGYQKSSTIDNYISSIVKTEESVSLVWSSNRLTTACQKGHTLIYDEFTRSPATANNPFLSILEEGILNIPSSGREKGYIRVDPNFRVIFTSNPEEYVGVHKTQDALLDRMITIELEYPDHETEVAIVAAKGERSVGDAEQIVRIVRTVRDKLGGKNGPTVRAAIAIAKILNYRDGKVDVDDPIFLITCKDVLAYHVSRQGDGRAQLESIIKELGYAPSTISDPFPPVQEDTFTGQLRVENTPTHEERVLESTLDLSQAVEQRLRSQSSISPTAMPSDASLLTVHRANRNDGLPRPPATIGTTASPQQMLEAAVNRFMRPPQTVNASGGIVGFASS